LARDEDVLVLGEIDVSKEPQIGIVIRENKIETFPAKGKRHRRFTQQRFNAIKAECSDDGAI
jgi:hypothetical protein